MSLCLAGTAENSSFSKNNFKLNKNITSEKLTDIMKNSENGDKNEINETCPKCKSNDVVFHGNWTGVMVSDRFAEHFWICECESCGFKFAPATEENKPDPVNFKRDYA